MTEHLTGGMAIVGFGATEMSPPGGCRSAPAGEAAVASARTGMSRQTADREP